MTRNWRLTFYIASNEIMSRPSLSTFLNGRSDLSGMMALRIEKAFGVKMDTLMRMQSSYDIARTRRREGELDIEPYGVAASQGSTGISTS